jgi:hypothetical protein
MRLPDSGSKRSLRDIGQSELEITEMFEFKMVGRYIILITDGLLRNREE